MNNQLSKQETRAFEIFPVGHVVRKNGKTYLDILKCFIPALKQLEYFSHVQVFWWFNCSQDAKCRKILQTIPPYENAPLAGVFACRSPVRPNPNGFDHDKSIAG